LSSVKGGFSPDVSFNPEEILWDIKMDTIFVSNSSSQYPFPPISDNYYKYSKTSDVIILNETFSYKYALSSDSLIVSDGEITADGKKFIFVKFIK
jgi:hypothetical protein